MPAEPQIVAGEDGVMRVVMLDRPATPDDVNAERDRRIAAGAIVTLPGRSFMVQTRDDRDFRNVNGLASRGIVLLMQGSGDTTEFRDADNATQSLAPAELIAMGEQVAAHVAAVYQASWAIKSASPIPADYADDSRWP